ncbi:GATA zinc finger domain-containing protein 14-like isoform X2 [Oppia nitens]|uniref:GATA zinc finger domain-containing protein 14-like isoform X2 n=1 Tax=Oppia nitens TaxID=1686743 RepID=UPI0023D9E7E4|nr:GATA zinc finger domain-containing protein 14-like isoform X2 [Oppia nitens]
MQSSGHSYDGPSVVSTDIYEPSTYQNHDLTSHGVSNNYLTYHSQVSQDSGYCGSNHYTSSSATHPTHTHITSSAHISQYNSSNLSHNYGQSMSHLNDMYSRCGSYAALPPDIRQPIGSSNIKYWNSDQLSHNNLHNNYQGIPPPPLTSRPHPLRSPTDRSHNLNNNYNRTSGQHRSASQSPQDWCRSSNVMPSPSATPSPLPSHVNNSRSPSHVSPQFSPSHTSPSLGNESSQHSKMVLIESDGQDVRNNNDNIDDTGLQTNGTVSYTPNSINKNYSNDQNTDPDSPYPTYYNMDQNRMCTPPQVSPQTNPKVYANIPDASRDGQQSESDKELNKCDNSVDKCNNHNMNNDLNYSVKDDSNSETTIQPIVKLEEPLTGKSANLINGENGKHSLDNDRNGEQTVGPHCKRSSQESLPTSDSEKTRSTYNENRGHHNWPMENNYYDNRNTNKNSWPHWQQTSQMPPMLYNSNPVPSSMTYNSAFNVTQCGSGMWSASGSSSQSSGSKQNFAPPNNMRQQGSAGRKRGRPFGSKNRRNSDDTNSETNTSDASNSVKKKKKCVSTEDMCVNTEVTLDAHGFDELSVVNPLKVSSKRKKFIGPFIRVEKGKGRKATVYSIVNTSTKPEDEKDGKTKSQTIKSEPIKQPIRRPSLLVSSKKVMSTFSPEYDYNTRDKTWVCALCHMGPHYKGLGDLFGPYYISEDKTKITSSPHSSNSRSDTVNQTNKEQIVNKEHSGSDKPRRGRPKKKSETNEIIESPKSRPKVVTKSINLSQNNEINESTEVWVHENCIVWSSGVYLIGHRVRHLEEIICESMESFCTKCKLSGATLGCLQKSCNTSQYHYLCAKEIDCELDDENFSLLCPKHKKKKKNTSNEPSVA